VAVFISHQNGTQYFTSAYQALGYDDIAQGLTKPLFFGFIIATVGCYFGMKTSGGTQGVGRSTTQAVVVSSVLLIFCDFILSRALLWLYSGI
jgi:phospholipid/cholesterol/gamma-HCH transport system permease protein